MTIQHITALLLQYKYLIMFGLMLLEGPVVAFLCAFLAAKGYFNFGIVYLLSVSWDVIPDTLRYLAGRLSRHIGRKQIEIVEKKRNIISKTLLHRFVPMYNWIARKINKLEEKAFFMRMDNHAKKHFFLSLFVIKITPPLSVTGHFSFGFLKIPFRKFVPQTALIALLLESIFLNLWYFSGISVSTFQNKFNLVTTIITSIAIWIIALAIGFFIVKKIRALSKKLK